MSNPSNLPFRSGRPEIIGRFLFLCAGFADGMVVPFFPLWAYHEANVTIGLIGVLFGCYAGGELLATPLLCGIADRIGRRPVLTLSSLGVGLGFTLLFFARGAILVAAVLLAIGICECVFHPTISAVIADVTPAVDHRRQFSFARVSSGVGRVLGPLVGAALAWRSIGYVFLTAGAALLLGGVVVLLFLPETRQADGPVDDDDEEASFAALLPAFGDRRLASLLVWFMLLSVAGSWIEAVLPLYANGTGILTASGVGLLFTYASALTVIAQLAVTRVTARRSATALILAAGATLTLAFVVLIAWPPLDALVVAVTLYAASDMLIGPLIPTAVNELAPAHRRATYMAATSVANDLRDSVGPATGTALFATASSLPWVIGIPLAAVAALGLSVTISHHNPQRDAAANS